MSSNAAAPETDKPLRLRNFHITFFPILPGVVGFFLAVEKIAGTGGSGMTRSPELVRKENQDQDR